MCRNEREETLLNLFRSEVLLVDQERIDAGQRGIGHIQGPAPGTENQTLQQLTEEISKLSYSTNVPQDPQLSGTSGTAGPVGLDEEKEFDKADVDNDGQIRYFHERVDIGWSLRFAVSQPQRVAKMDGGQAENNEGCKSGPHDAHARKSASPPKYDS